MEGCVVRLHNVRFRGDVSAQPIRINFHQLFQTRDAPAILPTIKNEDVLGAVVALLDTSLPDIGPRDVLETVRLPGVQTLILSRDPADVLEEYRGKRPRNKGRGQVPCKKTERAESSHNLLVELYSDSEESQEEPSEESSEEALAEEALAEDNSNRWSWDQFCEGLQDLVDGVRNRRERRKLEGEEEIPPSAVGVESLIVAAACYEFKQLSTGEKVLQFSLLAVRKRFWNLGIGGYIMELLKTQSVVGQYDAFVVHADCSAVGFFKHHGLTEDLLLNDKFRELKDDWTNSILMSYLPPFTTDLEMRNPSYFPNLQELETDLDIARSHALFAYQQQVICVTRLIREVKTLHEQLDLKREEAERLNSKLEQEKQKRQEIEHRFLMYRLKNTEQLLDNIVSDSDVLEHADHERSSPGQTEQEVEHSEESFIQTPAGDECC